MENGAGEGCDKWKSSASEGVGITVDAALPCKGISDGSPFAMERKGILPLDPFGFIIINTRTHGILRGQFFFCLQTTT